MAILATSGLPRYGSPMAKRLRVEFNKPGGSRRVEEDGQAKPCATGVGWVNNHTLQTLDKCDIKRTDAKGNPLPEDSAK